MNSIDENKKKFQATLEDDSLKETSMIHNNEETNKKTNEEMYLSKGNAKNLIHKEIRKFTDTYKLPISTWIIVFISVIAFLFWYYITEKDNNLQRQIQDIKEDIKIIRQKVHQ